LSANYFVRQNVRRPPKKYVLSKWGTVGRAKFPLQQARIQARHLQILKKKVRDARETRKYNVNFNILVVLATGYLP
jgi:hypothetical protein